MPVTSPPLVALREFLGATTRHIRRIEIYEADGVTRWAKDTKSRLKDGSVSVDYDRDERRALDLTLDNSDDALVNAPGEFWYDKIIKVYRGVIVREAPRLPKVLVVADNAAAPHAEQFRRALVELGFGDVRINALATDYAVDVHPYDIIVSLGGADKGNLLETAYNAGKSIFVVREAATQLYNALYNGTTWAGVNIGDKVPGDVVATNLYPNPKMIGTAGGIGNYASGTRGTHTVTEVGGDTNVQHAATSLGTTDADRAGTRVLLPTATLGIAGGDQVTWSASFRRMSGSTTKQMRLYVDYLDAVGGYVTGAGAGTMHTAMALTGTATQRISVTHTVPATATEVRAYLWMQGNGGVAEAVTAQIGSLQLEKRSSASAYFNGDTPDDPATFFYNWTGAVNNSSSEKRTPVEAPDYTVAPVPVSDPRTLGWTSFLPNRNNGTFKAPATSLAGTFGVAYAPGDTSYLISSRTNSVGGKLVAVHYLLNSQQYTAPQFRNFLLATFGWLNPVETILNWEVQIGEFMIDRISEPHRPREMKITGRDYTKKCMNSKFTGATNFVSGQKLESLIASIAGAAGITKRLLPATGVVVARAFFFERGTSRWDAMKAIATAYNYELFFDATGYLTMRPFRDPTTSTPVIYIETGKEGQIAGYEKSTSDAQLFNHILVAGENSDADIPLVWAEAKNTDPNSPTAIAKIGARYWEYVSEFVTTKAQAQQLANSYLAIHALEEFELSFETLVLPWLEVGDILGFVDPNPAPDDPSTFLLSTLDLPLGLAAMSGVGRRVTIVS